MWRSPDLQREGLRLTWVRGTHRPRLFLALCSLSAEDSTSEKIAWSSFSHGVMPERGREGEGKLGVQFHPGCSAGPRLPGGLCSEEISGIVTAGDTLTPLGTAWRSRCRDARGSLAVLPEPCCLLLWGFFGCCRGWGSLARSSPALSLPPPPTPAADFPFRSEKHLPVAWQRSAGGGGAPGGDGGGPAAGASSVPVVAPPHGSGHPDRAGTGRGGRGEAAGAIRVQGGSIGLPRLQRFIESICLPWQRVCLKGERRDSHCYWEENRT